jgi:hypothetical protein
MNRILSSAEPPEVQTQPGLTTAKIRVVVVDLESIANDAASEGEHAIASLARNLSSQLWARLNRSGEHSVAPPAPPSNPPRNTGV